MGHPATEQDASVHKTPAAVLRLMSSTKRRGIFAFFGKQGYLINMRLYTSILATLILCAPIYAQRGGTGGTGGTGGGSAGGRSTPPPVTTAPGSTGGTGVGLGTQPDIFWDPDVPVWVNRIGLSPPLDPVQKDEECLQWTVAGVQGVTISAVRLSVPKEARKDLEGACSAVKANRADQARELAQKAISEYPNYVTAKVLLGQIALSQEKLDDADAACEEALTTDANYIPAMLCIADVAYRQQDWETVVDYSTRALALDMSRDAYAYFYRSGAQFNLEKMDAAESDAKKAISIDRYHREPEMYFLLSRIHQAQGDFKSAVSDLREFLKLQPNGKDSDLAKEDLARIEPTLKR